MSLDVKAQFSLLLELKKIDDQIIRRKRGLSSIPVDIAKLQAALDERKADFDSAKSVVEQAEKRLRQAEQDLKAHEDHIAKSESKLMECKTNEEYKAAQKEIDEQKKEVGSLEEEMLKLMNALEGQRERLKTDEAKYKSYEESFRADKKQLDEEQAKLEGLVAESEALQESLKAKLPPPIRSLYERILRGGIVDPVSVVENGRCKSCYMAIRPQLFNEVLAYKAVERCPHCTRLIVIEHTGNEDSDDATSANAPNV